MDERIWTDRPLAFGDVLERDRAKISQIEAPQNAYLISGDLDAALQALGPGIPVLGLLEYTNTQTTYAIRIARHRVLMVSDTPLAENLGWNSRGFGISDASDLYAVFEVEGDESQTIFAEGGVTIPCQASPSAATLFADLTVLLTHHEKSYRLWVPRAMQTYISTFLQRT